MNAVDVGSGVDRVLVVPALLLARPADIDRLAELTGRPRDELHAQIGAAPGPRCRSRSRTCPAAPATQSPRPGSPACSWSRTRVGLPAGRRCSARCSASPGSPRPQDEERWPDLPQGEIVGRAGLEQQYDAVLRGINGRQCLYVNPQGVPAALGERQDPVPGADVRLSIDLGLQGQLDASLAAAVRAQPRPRGRIGAAVAMDPKSGQVLAIASTPSFDNNVYGPPVDARALRDRSGAPGSPMLEHVTQAVVPPGSTFKLVVAAANQAHPAFAPDRAVPTGADFTYGGHTFGNWKPMGPMNLAQSLAMSNDVYFYKLAVALGPEKMIDTARALGVGQRTGIDLPAESAGYLGTPDSVREDGGTWYGGSTVILGIGQGYLQVTPLQNARWTAAVATGNLVTPRLGLAIGSGGTYTALPAPPATPLPFAGALAPIREGMRSAVTGGTAVRLADLPVPVGAKTGTAQDGGLPDGDYDNWMTAAAP